MSNLLLAFIDVTSVAVIGLFLWILFDDDDTMAEWTVHGIMTILLAFFWWIARGLVALGVY